MSGPSWLIGKGTKEALKSLGVDPLTATVVARGLHVVSSTIFHDHHTHSHPYGDEISDASDILDNATSDDQWDYDHNTHETLTEQRSGDYNRNDFSHLQRSGKEVLLTDTHKIDVGDTITYKEHGVEQQGIVTHINEGLCKGTYDVERLGPPGIQGREDLCIKPEWITKVDCPHNK